MTNTISYIRSELQDIYPDGEANAIARLILCEEFGLNLLDIYMGKDIQFSTEQWQILRNIISRLKKYEPIQYILGYADFCGLRFAVNSHVLIPRPETAELVETILTDYSVPPLRVLDIGSGSGCIPIALSHHWPDSEVISWDVSKEALEVARDNNKQLRTNVCFEWCDVLQDKENGGLTGGTLDLIVSNPPYIKDDERLEMERNVLGWEPELALFVPNNDPLLFYRVIAQKAYELLKSGGNLYFEINRSHGSQTMELLKKIGFESIVVYKDLSGNERVVKAQRPEFNKK